MSLSSVLGTLAGKVSGFITKDIEPAILNLLGLIRHDVVAAIVPLATEAVGEIGVALAANPTQSVASDIDIISTVAKATLPKLEQAAISATALEVVAGAKAALANAAAANTSASAAATAATASS